MSVHSFFFSAVKTSKLWIQTDYSLCSPWKTKLQYSRAVCTATFTSVGDVFHTHNRNVFLVKRQFIIWVMLWKYQTKIMRQSYVLHETLTAVSLFMRSFSSVGQVRALKTRWVVYLKWHFLETQTTQACTVHAHNKWYMPKSTRSTAEGNIVHYTKSCTL